LSEVIAVNWNDCEVIRGEDFLLIRALSSRVLKVEITDNV